VWPMTILAEGVYDAHTGHMVFVGVPKSLDRGIRNGSQAAHSEGAQGSGGGTGVAVRYLIELQLSLQRPGLLAWADGAPVQGVIRPLLPGGLQTGVNPQDIMFYAPTYFDGEPLWTPKESQPSGFRV